MGGVAPEDVGTAEMSRVAEYGCQNLQKKPCQSISQDYAWNIRVSEDNLNQLRELTMPQRLKSRGLCVLRICPRF